MGFTFLSASKSEGVGAGDYKLHARQLNSSAEETMSPVLFLLLLPLLPNCCYCFVWEGTGGIDQDDCLRDKDKLYCKQC